MVVENGQIVARYQSLMNAGVRIPSDIEWLTGISNKMVRDAPPSASVMAEFARFIGDLPLVAHNASFDRKFLDAELTRIRVHGNRDFVCSLRVARRVYPDAPNHKLETLIRYTSLPGGRHHRALADAEMTAHLWIEMGQELQRTFGLRTVPLDLLRAVQMVPCRALVDRMPGLKQRYGV